MLDGRRVRFEQLNVSLLYLSQSKAGKHKAKLRKPGTFTHQPGMQKNASESFKDIQNSLQVCRKLVTMFCLISGHTESSQIKKTEFNLGHW